VLWTVGGEPGDENRPTLMKVRTDQRINLRHRLRTDRFEMPNTAAGRSSTALPGCHCGVERDATHEIAHLTEAARQHVLEEPVWIRRDSHGAFAVGRPFVPCGWMSLGPGVRPGEDGDSADGVTRIAGEFDDRRRNGLYPHDIALVLEGVQRLAPFGRVHVEL
jgi:hypothetical protein